MLKVYSAVEKDIMLFSLIRQNEIVTQRQDIAPDEEFLQVGAKKINAGDYFRPHRHLPCHKIINTTQEAWVILNGQVQGIFYDLDETKVSEITLNSGDCIVIFRGGHALRCLTDDTILYEFKTGPYYGAEQDKTFLEVEDEL